MRSHIIPSSLSSILRLRRVVGLLAQSKYFKCIHMIQENVQIIKILHLIKYTGSQVTVMSKEESCVDVFPAATATKRPKVL